MAFIYADMVKETTSITGTGIYNLDGAASGFQSFLTGIGDGNSFYYCCRDDVQFEVGIGTFTDGTPDTISRDTILDSSNAGAAVNWTVGDKDIYVTETALSITNNAKINVQQTFAAGQTGSTQINASATGNITLDFATYNNFIFTLTGNLILDNPTTEVVGQSGFITFIQDGTGSRTLSLGSEFKNPAGISPTLSTTAGAVDVVGYVVIASGQIALGSPILDIQ